MECDIVVIGGAMAGAALAAKLTGAGLRVVVLEAAPQPKALAEQFDARVVALNSASKQLLTEVGAWAHVDQSRVAPYSQMLVWDAEGSGQIDFDVASLKAEALGYIVENANVVHALYQTLQRNDVPYIAAARVQDVRLTNGGGAAEVDYLRDGELHSVSARLVVAADGAQSFTRKLAGIDTLEWDYAHNALVCVAQTAKPHGFTARQRFLTDGPLALLPLQNREGDSGWHAIVWSCVPARADALLALDDAAFQRELSRASEHCLGEIIQVGKRAMLPLKQRHAKVYWRDRIVLIGDAAHTIHPLAGQGVNLGFADVRALADELTRARARGLDLAERSVLERYQRQRLAENVTMAAAMEGFQHLFGSKALPLRLLRNAGMSGLAKLPLLKNLIAKQAMGLR